MELKSYQRAFLRSHAVSLGAVIYIGKEGITENVISALDKALTDHELVKVKFNRSKDEIDSLSKILSEKTHSSLVSITGFTSVFFRQDPTSPERIYKI